MHGKKGVACDEWIVCDGMTQVVEKTNEVLQVHGNSTCHDSQVVSRFYHHKPNSLIGDDALIIINYNHYVHCMNGMGSESFINEIKFISSPIQQVDDLQVALLIINDGHLNSMGLRIPVRTNWNLRLFDSLSRSQSDKEVLTFLRYI